MKDIERQIDRKIFSTWKIWLAQLQNYKACPKLVSCLSVFLSFCHSVFLYFCLSVFPEAFCLFVFLSICLFVFFCLSVFPEAFCLFVFCLSVFLFFSVFLSFLRLFVFLSVFLSFCLLHSNIAQVQSYKACPVKLVISLRRT
jgi:hypothetical protein